MHHFVYISCTCYCCYLWITYEDFTSIKYSTFGYSISCVQFSFLKQIHIKSQTNLIGTSCMQLKSPLWTDTTSQLSQTRITKSVSEFWQVDKNQYILIHFFKFDAINNLMDRRLHISAVILNCGVYRTCNRAYTRLHAAHIHLRYTLRKSLWRSAWAIAMELYTDCMI